MRFAIPVLAVSVIVAGGLAACSESPAPKSHAQATEMKQDVNNTLTQFRDRDPSIDRFINNSYGYAVFPSVTTGGVGLGGAYGKGTVYQQGRLVGYADLSQANVGAQLGGQTYSEIIFFQNAQAFNDFRNGQLALDARASAIAADRGAAASADYQKGVAVFTLPQGGLMFQAAVGGQQFRYMPANQATASEK